MTPSLSISRTDPGSLPWPPRVGYLRFYGFREFPDDGGLMSYGTNLISHFRHPAKYVDKMLQGAKPADLAIEQPTKLELVINMRTAKALGLTIPPTLLAGADEIIE